MNILNCLTYFGYDIDKLIVTDTDFSFRDGDYNWCKIKINEESILNTINQIEEYGKDKS